MRSYTTNPIAMNLCIFIQFKPGNQFIINTNKSPKALRFAPLDLGIINVNLLGHLFHLRFHGNNIVSNGNKTRVRGSQDKPGERSRAGYQLVLNTNKTWDIVTNKNFAPLLIVNFIVS